MIYAPGRFCFIHIPRTAGMSITATLVQHLTGNVDIIASTTNMPPLHRHSRALELRDLIEDWDSIYKFAFYRPSSAIYASDYRLHRMAQERIGTGQLHPAWEATVRMAMHESFDEFVQRRWVPWLAGDSIWAHWTCQDPTIHRFDFRRLSTEWPRLLKAIGVDPSLPLQRVNRGNTRFNKASLVGAPT
ncbi:MAG: hypothetical protein AAGJ40_02920 [Planctomycetota bacterium]